LANIAALKRLAQVQLSVVGTPTTIYTAPAQPPNAITVVIAFWVCNTAAAGHSYTIRSGTGALTAANSLFEAKAIAANVTDIFDASQEYGIMTLNAGQSILGYADVAATITVTVAGVEYT